MTSRRSDSSLPKNYMEVLRAQLSWLQREVDALNGSETEDGFYGDITRAQGEMGAVFRSMEGIVHALESGTVQFSELQEPLQVRSAPSRNA